MEIGIIGLPRSGKTTLFNSLTRAKAETRAFAASGVEPNLGVVKVPDGRLEGLQALLNPKRLVPAEVKYVDVAVSSERKDGLSGPARSHLTKTDALIGVVRAFTDEAVPSRGGVDPWRDIGALDASYNEVYTVGNPGFHRATLAYPGVALPRAVRRYDSIEVAARRPLANPNRLGQVASHFTLRRDAQRAAAVMPVVVD